MATLLIGPVLRHVDAHSAVIWVETDGPCDVEVLGVRERTWTVAGHHFGLVEVDGLEAGSSTSYQVHLDGVLAWPAADSTRPPCRIRTLAPDRPVRLAFGSCRYATSAAVAHDRHFDDDSLACYSRQIASFEEDRWPDAFLMLGDQVYADETTEATKQRIASRRDIAKGAKDQVADFEEYTWLYAESWSDPDVRWLMSTVSISMIFDDHDVRDDWNTSDAWRQDIMATSWWQERIIGALSSYWVYQHLGNLSPEELANDKLYQQVRSSGEDTEGLLREFAVAADKEVEGGKGARWSYRRDLNGVRLLVVDSRCGRILAEGERSMVSDEEFGWIEEQAKGNFDHLLIGTSVPWLMPRSLHEIESWNEVLSGGARGRRMARLAERFRRAGDLEHWAAFRKSFDRLADLIGAVGRGDWAGEGKRPPATACVLSGDVHHAYVAQARYDEPLESAVYQLTCSPLHNYVPAAMKFAFRISWSRWMERAIRSFLGLVAKLPPVKIEWECVSGPYFGNEVASLVFDGRRAELTLERVAASGGATELVTVGRVTLA